VHNGDVVAITDALLSDPLPSGLTFAGPVTLDPPGAGTVGPPPTLVSGLTIAPGQSVTVTLPVTVNYGLAAGTTITNTATLSSGTGAPVEDSVAITVANSAPVAVDDTAGTSEDTEVVVAVLQNDTDANNDPLFLDTVGTPLHGTGVVSGTQEVVYSPDPDFYGDDSFTYTASDGQLTDTGTVTVHVSPVNDPPTISDILDQSTYGYAVGPIPFTVGDVDDDPGTLALEGESSNKALVPDGNIVFGGAGANRLVTLTLGPSLYEGTTIITVTVSDGALTQSDTFQLTAYKHRIYVPLVMKSYS